MARHTDGRGLDDIADTIRDAFVQPPLPADAEESILKAARTQGHTGTMRGQRRPLRFALVAASLAVLGLAVVWTLPITNQNGAPSTVTGPVRPVFESADLEAAWAVISEPDHVFHAIARVEQEQASAWSWPPDGLMKVETWSDPESGRSHTTRYRAIEDGWLVMREELVADGVWSIADADLSVISEPVWTQISQHNAENSEKVAEALWIAGDFDAYRSALETGTATLIGESVIDGVATRAIRYETTPPYRAGILQVTTMHVSVDTDLPVQADIEMWWQPHDGQEPQEMNHGTVFFELIETIPIDQAPEDVFALSAPTNLPTYTYLSMDLDEIAAIEEVSVEWIGPSWRDLDVVYDDITDTNYFKQVHDTTAPYRNWFDGPGPESATLLRPTLGSYPEVSVSYTTEEPDAPVLTIVTMRRVPPLEWEERSWGRIANLNSTATGKQTAIVNGTFTTVEGASITEELTASSSATGRRFRVGDPDTPPEIYWYLVMDRPDSTVILQGYKLSEEDLTEAAEQLEILADTR